MEGVYIGDLLSWVMGRAQSGNAWLTIMSNLNIVAVATLSDVSCILLCEGVTLDESVRSTADAKGVNIVTLEDSCQLRFLPLDTPRFYDWELEVGADAAAALCARLPGAGSRDFYRITFTGESEPIDCDNLLTRFSQFPNLQLRDRTVPPMDLWASVGSDTLEGAYFGMLRQAMEGADPETCRKIALAARISRQLLDGREVKLP